LVTKRSLYGWIEKGKGNRRCSARTGEAKLERRGGERDWRRRVGIGDEKSWSERERKRKQRRRAQKGCGLRRAWYEL
jgi:hypothetical protein